MAHPATDDAEDAAPGAELPAELVRRAGRAILGADFLLVAGGAGMSADSGLATFATMGEKMGHLLGGLTYDQAASSDNMFRNPEQFYGFWFTSMRSYAEAAPHGGYAILRKWAEHTRHRAARQHLAQRAAGAADGPPPVCATQPVFALTTNVDGFLLRSEVVAPGSIGEIHGSVARWQCGGVPSGRKFPLVQRPRCGDVLFDPPPADGTDFAACRYGQPAPRCPGCGEGWARPHVYLFGDGSRFVDDRERLGLAAYGRWRESVLAALRASPGLRLAIVEIGCGLRVPTLRKRCEELLAEAPPGQCELLRVNPEFAGQGLVAAPTVALKAPALAALRRIHRDVEREMEPAGPATNIEP